MSRSELVESVSELMRVQAGRALMLHAAIAGRLGLHFTDLKCLDLVRDATLTAGEIASAIGLSASAVSAMLDRLEGQGFIERVRDSGDRRKVFVRKTGRYDDRIDQLFAGLASGVGGILGVCTDEQLEFLAGIVEQFNELSASAAAEITGGATRSAVGRPARPALP
ncbi:MarR family winged helix-turn-helix transcriptional regulator [Humibacter antri]